MPTINEQNITNTDQDLSLSDLLLKIKILIKILKRKKTQLLLIIILGAIVGFLYSYIKKPTYSAKLTFSLEEDKGSSSSGIGAAAGLASQFGIDLGSGAGGVFAASNITELMISKYLIQKTLLDTVRANNKVKTLANIYIDEYKLRKKWKKYLIENIDFPINQNRENFSLKQDSILDVLSEEIIKNNLKVFQKEKKVSIISIEVISENEIFSKSFCELLAFETSKFYIQTKSKKARINSEILQKQADSVRNVLNNAIVGVASASDNVYNLNPAFNIKSTNSRKHQVDVQANTAVLTQLLANLEVSKINLRKETPLIQVIDVPRYPLVKNKLNKVKYSILSVFLFSLLYILFLIYSNSSILFKNENK